MNAYNMPPQQGAAPDTGAATYLGRLPGQDAPQQDDPNAMLQELIQKAQSGMATPEELQMLQALLQQSGDVQNQMMGP